MSELSFIHGDRIALDDDPIDLRCERCGDEASVPDSKETRSWCALCAPDILIEVSDGGAILTRKTEEVTVLIIDHDEIQFMKWDEADNDLAIQHAIQDFQWKKLGSKQIDSFMYASVGYMYLKFIQERKKHPVMQLAKFMNCPRATASARLAKARALGFLTSNNVGSFGGNLTAKGKTILNSTADTTREEYHV